MADEATEFTFAISLSVLNHLGRNLYRNFITVVAEAISNSWDADANNVWINIDRDAGVFSIKDDGVGMDEDDFQNKFLKIGYSKRADGNTKTDSGRPYIGAKGIGKLALLSCAERVTIVSKKTDDDYVGGVIDNGALDDAITDNLEPQDYPLEKYDTSSLEELFERHDRGTIVLFENVHERIRNSIPYLRKMLALSFRFSLIDENFSLHVNGEEITFEDIRDVLDKTEFVWSINESDDAIVNEMTRLKEKPIKITTALAIKGFIASVELPRHLKVTGTEERASIDLFVNGRLREKNILRRIPTQRIVESYTYGQVHFDDMDDGSNNDPFTSSREGIKEDDEKFDQLLALFKGGIFPQVMDEWDKLRLKHKKDGDDDNARKSKKRRRARSLANESRGDFTPDEDAETKDEVEAWLDEMMNDAEFYLSSYADIFFSENLVRRYLTEYKIPISHKGVQGNADKWRAQETDGKSKANISFDIRESNEDVDYLGMHDLAITAEGNKPSGQEASLWNDAIYYTPLRNVVGHTGRLTKNAKMALNLQFENIKARVRAIISSKP